MPLYTAWVCDDKNDVENAVFCRKTALSVSPDFINKESNKETLIVVKADIMRRVGKFVELIEEYKDMKLTDSLLNRIIAFQIERAKNQDTNCYTVQDTCSENAD